MPPIHPAMAEAHTRARVEQFRREAAARPLPVHGGPGRRRLRTSAGWLLINVGLHLVLPPGPVAPATG
jgi:hypothetical protein